MLHVNAAILRLFAQAFLERGQNVAHLQCPLVLDGMALSQITNVNDELVALSRLFVEGRSHEHDVVLELMESCNQMVDEQTPLVVDRLEILMRAVR